MARVLHIEDHAGECLNYEIMIFLFRIIRTKQPGSSERNGKKHKITSGETRIVRWESLEKC